LDDRSACRHDRGESPLHVEGSATVKPVSNDLGCMRVLHAGNADGIQMAVEHERTPTARPTRDRNDIRSPRHRFVEGDLKTGTAKPVSDEVGNRLLPQTAWDQIWID